MAYSQQNQPLALTTAAWQDLLLMTDLSGREGVSQLFEFRFDFAAENAKVAKAPVEFHKLLGQSVTARLTLAGPGKTQETRFFSGIVAEFGQGASDDTFTGYHAVVVPRVWLATRRARSRIFQHESVKSILVKVFGEYCVGSDKLVDELGGPYEPRDFCVQYRETDFNFACRLMEEEGIFYFFRHKDGAHELVLADSPKSYPALARPAIFVSALNASHRPKFGQAIITSWSKRQELRSGRYTLWDHTFELPHKDLAASQNSPDAVTAGKAEHKLRTAANANLELYDWPGEYAQRFDGIAPGGGDRAADVQKVFKDNKRTVAIRMDQEVTGAVAATAVGEWHLMGAGTKFALEVLPDDKKAEFLQAPGQYVVTAVTHTATMGVGFRPGGPSQADYGNHFTAQPLGLPLRPARTTPKPVVQGTQSAVVVGPSGEEIFTDKYGRVKVQFHWDQLGKRDADSSCWIRVGTVWAGRAWGGVHIPRVGQEVLIDFLEGDPDQPVIIGSLYNPDQMPAYKLPDHKTRSWVRSNSTPGGKGHNEFRFEDKAGAEQIYIHGQRNLDTRIRNDSLEKVGHDRHQRVGFYIPPADDDGPPPEEKKHGSLFEEVAVDVHSKVHKDKSEHVGGNVQVLVGGIDGGEGNVDVHLKGAKHEQIDKSSDLTVKGKVTETYKAGHDTHVTGERNEKVDMSVSLTVGQNYQEKTGMKHAVDAGQEIHLKGGMNVVIEAGMQLTLKGPGGFITISPAGVAIQGTMVLINSGGAAGAGSGSSPTSPKDAEPPKDAKPTKPQEADSTTSGKKSN